MTLALAGELALWVALLFAIWGVVVSAAAGSLARADLAASGTRAIHATAVMLGLALLVLGAALFDRQFGLAYVAAFGGIAATTREMIVALWAAPPGALLVLGVVLAAVASLGLHVGGTGRPHEAASAPAAGSERDRSIGIPEPAAAIQLVLLGVIATLLASESPFERLPFPAGDGRGLPPHLRAPIMLVLWPAWAAATSAAAVAYGLSIAGALAWRGDDGLAMRAVRWAHGAWVLHSAALLAALWWSRGLVAGETGWISLALPAASIVAWLSLLAAAHLPEALDRPRTLGVRARTSVLALPLPILLLSALLAAEGGWQPLHELLHGIGAVWWIVLIAATLQVLAYALYRARTVTTPLPQSPRPTRTLAARLTWVGAALVVAGLAADLGRREQAVVLQPGEPRALEGALGREWSLTYQGLSVRERRSELGAPLWRELLLPVVLAPGDAGSAGADAELLVPEVREHVDVLGRPTAPPWPRPAVRRGVLQDVIIAPDSLGDDESARMRVTFAPLAGLVWLGGAALLLAGAIGVVAARR